MSDEFKDDCKEGKLEFSKLKSIEEIKKHLENFENQVKNDPKT